MNDGLLPVLVAENPAKNQGSGFGTSTSIQRQKIALGFASVPELGLSTPLCAASLVGSFGPTHHESWH
jgi:hypothetical protein